MTENDCYKTSEVLNNALNPKFMLIKAQKR